MLRHGFRLRRGDSRSGNNEVQLELCVWRNSCASSNGVLGEPKGFEMLRASRCVVTLNSGCLSRRGFAEGSNAIFGNRAPPSFTCSTFLESSLKGRSENPAVSTAYRRCVDNVAVRGGQWQVVHSSDHVSPTTCAKSCTVTLIPRLKRLADDLSW